MVKIHRYKGKLMNSEKYVEGQLIISPGPCNKGKCYILSEMTAAYLNEIRGLIFGEFLEVDPKTIEEVR